MSFQQWLGAQEPAVAELGPAFQAAGYDDLELLLVRPPNSTPQTPAGANLARATWCRRR